MLKTDVLIIGGGVIGCSIAYELAKAGRRVHVLEQRTLGWGASGVSAAMLEAQLDMPESGPFHDLALASRDLFKPLSQELQHETGLSIGYERCGILRIAATEAERHDLEARFRWQAAQRQSVEWLEAAEARRRLLTWRGPNHGGIFYAGDGQVIASNFVKALVRAARQKGVEFSEGTEAVDFETASGRVTVVRTPKEALSAHQVILAGGAWAVPLAARLGFTLPIEPVRGQLISYRTPDRLIPWPVYVTEGYFTPKPDGTTWVGSTRERVGFVNETTPEAIEALKAFTKRCFPKLAAQPFDGARAGLRPGPLPDGLPAIGPVPDWSNVWIATGHYRNGVLLAPITAHLLRQALVEDLAIPYPAVLPERLLTARL